MRRLNRYEYNNAVRDLLQLRGDIYPLPEKVIRASRYFNFWALAFGVGISATHGARCACHRQALAHIHYIQRTPAGGCVFLPGIGAEGPKAPAFWRHR